MRKSTDSPPCIAILLAGGTGTRAGAGTPKQYQMAGKHPLIYYSLRTLLTHPCLSGVWTVAEEGYRGAIRQIVSQPALSEAGSGLLGFSSPGSTRQLSICNAVHDLTSQFPADTRILIHDSARPALTGQLITDCLNALGTHDGVMPVLPVTDTIYASTDGTQVSSLLDRSTLYAGQAPELFRLGAYANALAKLDADTLLSVHGSSEPAVMAGLDIALIPGDPGNFKITTREDLERFCREISKATS